MLKFLKKNRIHTLALNAAEYADRIRREARADPEAGYNAPGTNGGQRENRVRYSSRAPQDSLDRYSAEAVSTVMRSRDETRPEALEKVLGNSLDLSFSQKLTEIINRKGVKNSQVYRAAHMDRRLFSKILSDRYFSPAKDTVLALAFALQLTLPEASDLLTRAGFTLSHSDRRDVVLEYFLREGIHDLTDINLVLEELNQKIIGRTA